MASGVPASSPGGNRARKEDVTGPLARTPRLRGLAVVMAAAVVVTGSAWLAGAAHSSPALPAITPEALVANTVRALAARPTVSGTVTVHVDLGLPDIPDVGAGAGGAGALIGSLSGDHRVRVWHSPRESVRISDLLPSGERSLIATRTDLWLWDSSSTTAVHLRAPRGMPAGERDAALRALTSSADPLQLARQTLAALDSTTRVSVSGTISVAGRSAYVLSLEPRTDQTLIGRVDLYVDATRWLPLGGAIYPRGAGSPSVSARFTSVSYAPIASSVFSFTPPPGAKVVTVPTRGTGIAARTPLSGTAGIMPKDCPPATGGCGDGATKARTRLIRSRSPVHVIGTGWTTVVAVDVRSVSTLRDALGQTGIDPQSLLPFSGPLFSIRLAEHGGTTWLLAGAVPQSALERAAAELP